MIKAILNADDFGISPQVNDAICRCFERQIITSTTLMVNMPYASDAVKLAKEQGFDRRVGLHLNLTAGVPLTHEIRSIPLFCSGNGKFNAAFHLSTAKRLHIDARSSKALSGEIEAQIQRYLALGLENMHLDSHHHSHTDLSVWKAALPLLKKYGFRSVRPGRNMYGAEKAGAFNRFYKKHFNASIRRNGFESPGFFGSFADLKGSWEALKDESFDRDILLEVMLHPMFSEDGVLMDTDTPMDEVLCFVRDKQFLTENY